VLLGAMALLGLVGLLRHRVCPGILSVRPRETVAPFTPRGTQTRRHPTGAWRVVVRGMIWPARKGCQTKEAIRARLVAAGRAGATMPGGRPPQRAFARIPPGGMRESPCDGVRAGAILSGPSAPGRSRESFSGPRNGHGSESSGRRMGVRRALRGPWLLRLQL
jgi:hypothetical protein